jgi:hypothetical protein
VIRKCGVIARSDEINSVGQSALGVVTKYRNGVAIAKTDVHRPGVDVCRAIDPLLGRAPTRPISTVKPNACHQIVVQICAYDPARSGDL